MFVISLAFIFLAVFKNILMWLLQRFWGDSSDFWQAQWDRLLDVIGDDLFTLSVYGTTIYTFAVYWIIGAIYTTMDITNKPAALRKYKIQAGTNEPVDPKRLMKVTSQPLPVSLHSQATSRMDGTNRSDCGLLSSN